MTATAREAVDRMRGEGKKVGLIKLRVFRPYPVEEVRRAVAGIGKIAVIDRNISAGAEGIFAQELKAALQPVGGAPRVHPFIVGLGGRDITPETFRSAVEIVEKRDRPGAQPDWLELKG